MDWDLGKFYNWQRMLLSSSWKFQMMMVVRWGCERYVPGGWCGIQPLLYLAQWDLKASLASPRLVTEFPQSMTKGSHILQA